MKTRIEEARSSGECSGQNVPNVEVSESDEGAGIAFHGQNDSPVGALLAELEALPVSDLQNDVGSVEAVTGAAISDFEKDPSEITTPTAAGTKVVMQENE